MRGRNEQHKSHSSSSSNNKTNKIYTQQLDKQLVGTKTQK
jgi:hypothetical protein